MVASTERFLKTPDVAELYGIHPDNVAKYAKAGKIPAPVYPFGPKAEPRWVASVVDAHIASFRPKEQQAAQ